MTGLQYRCTHWALTSRRTSGDGAETRQTRKTDRREQRHTLTVQQVLRKLLQNVFHAQGVSAVQPIKQVLCQFGAAFVISAVNSLNKRDETLFSGRNRKQTQTADQDLTEGAEDSVGGGGLAVLEQSLDLAQAAAAAGKHTKLLVLW